MKHKEFHLSELGMDSPFRESIRRRGEFTTGRLNLGQSLLKDALEAHDEEALTAGNFEKIMEHVRESQGYKRHMYSAGPALEDALREHLGIKPAE